MLVTIAKSQVMVAKDLETTVIYSDPMSIDGIDEVTCHLFIHYLLNEPLGDSLTYLAEVSMDGVHWASSSVTDTSNEPGLLFPQPVQTVIAAFIRFKFSFTAADDVVGAVCFDLHAELGNA